MITTSDLYEAIFRIYYIKKDKPLRTVRCMRRQRAHAGEAFSCVVFFKGYCRGGDATSEVWGQGDVERTWQKWVGIITAAFWEYDKEMFNSACLRVGPGIGRTRHLRREDNAVNRVERPSDSHRRALGGQILSNQ